MFGDLIELTATFVHSDHTPDIAPIGGPSTMPPRRRHSKSASISSVADVNGTLPPSSPASKPATPARKPRARPTTAVPESPAVPVARRHERVQKIPKPIQFIVVVLASIGLEAALQSAAALIGTGELAAVSKFADSWEEAIGLLGWKVVQLSVYWFGNFDAYDVASLTLLLNTPSALLLNLFYQIRVSTLAATTASSILATALPWLLLRPVSPWHHPSAAPKSTVRNRPILTDPYTTIATSLLATAIFAVLLEASFATFLPEWLITHFRGLRTLEPAHRGASGLPALLLALVPAGVASMEFLFTPSTAAAPGPRAATEFDSVSASFKEHVYHNLWGWYSSRQKELIARTTLLAALIVTESVVQIWGTIDGVELSGAVGYAGIWGLGVTVLGAVLDWVGGPSD